jgi:MYXO-CTERM domain-containing protein
VEDAAADTATQSDTPVIGNWADLGVAISGAPATSNIGATFDVVVTVTNNGPCDATDVFANDSDLNFAQGSTSLGLEFLGAEGDCTVDPTGYSRSDPTHTSCFWPTLIGTPPESKTWTVHYRVANFPNGLMQADEDVSYTVYSKADTAFDYKASNDVDRTKTIVKKNRANCSTGGGMGQALSLLALAVPFLRRRRKS